MGEIRVVRNWDELPPVVHDGSEVFSTRVLEKKYRIMLNALSCIANNCLDAEQCSDVAKTAICEVRK